MTVGIPGRLAPIIEKRMRQFLYRTRTDYFLALMIWDIYSRQPHARTGPLLNGPQWLVDNAVDRVLPLYGEKVQPGSVLPYRFTMRVPQSLYELAQKRIEEERSRSESAYVTDLFLFDLDPDVPSGKGVPHHKLSPLMLQPKWVKDAVFQRLAEDFGNPARKWPEGIVGRVDELVKQLRLRLE